MRPTSDPDGEGDYDLLREDGYNFEEILHHEYLDSEGQYLGPKPSAVRPPLVLLPPLASTKGLPKKSSGG